MAGQGLTQQERQTHKAKRLQAAQWFTEGIPRAEIARRLDVSRQAVYQWHQAWRAGGTAALASTGPPGHKPYLRAEQTAQVIHALAQGPAAYGFTGRIWTLARIRRVIVEVTEVAFHTPAGVWKLLNRLGWSAQVPARRAIERDEDAITAWAAQVWPQIKDGLRRTEPGSSSPMNPGWR